MAATEAQKARSRAYYARNKAQILAKRKAEYAANPAKFIAKAKAWREARPEEFKVHRRRSQRAKAGILDATGVQHIAPCAICSRVDTLVLDHEHSTGIIRGWLCGRCNRGLGSFKDCPEVLRAAAAYIELHEEMKKNVTSIG